MVFENFANKVKSKIPSKPWLIFMGCTGAVVSSVVYDKQQKKKIQKKLMEQVSYLADRPLPTDTYPRKVYVCMAPPMGSSTRKLKAHFEEYIKPIFDEAALDYEFLDSRIEGGLRNKVINIVHKRKQEEEDPSLLEGPVLGMPQLSKPRYALTEDLVSFGRASYREVLEGLNQGFLSKPPKEYIKNVNKIGHIKKKPVEKPKTTTPDKNEQKKKGGLFGLFNKKNKSEEMSNKDKTTNNNTIQGILY